MLYELQVKNKAMRAQYIKVVPIDKLSVEGLISYLLKSMAKLLLTLMLILAARICVPKCETAFRFKVRNVTVQSVSVIIP